MKLYLFRLDPATQKRLHRFRSLPRGYYSFLILLALIILSLGAELWVHSRALLVRYDGSYYFPTYGAVIPGSTFGEDYEYETKYRDLKKRFAEEGTGNWVLMPLVPYDAYETDFVEGSYPPYAPNISREHYLGTDMVGRDILARLVYGFRVAIAFSMILLFFNYFFGILIGAAMGYFGGRFDMIVQRLIEVWVNLPFLYIVIIIASVMVPSFTMLVGIMVAFGWMGMSWYMRTETYRERTREYALAAETFGASPLRIIVKHILPNALSVVITFIPFGVAGGISSLVALDFLGFGLPAPAPSWGELLSQGKENLSSIWIVSSVVSAIVVVLVLVTFVGEGLREAFDPKKHTVYE